MRPFPAFLPLAAALAIPSDVPPASFDPRAPIRAVPLALDIDRPGLSRVGRLRYVRGWVLSSANAQFGGISAMVLDRGRLTALSDEGWLISFRPTDTGMVDPRVAPVPVLGRRPDKETRDTEALALDPASGRVWMTTETRNAIWRFAPGFARAEAQVRPRAMRKWPANGGAESLARLPDGRFLVIAESKPGKGGMTRAALLFGGDPIARPDRPVRFSYRPPAGCEPSDAAALPDARVLVLHRCGSLRRGLEAAVSLLDLTGVRRGTVREGREIARLARPLAVDNMEALAVEPLPDGIHVWMASDDNLSIVQRTLLMEFVLEPGVAPG